MARKRSPAALAADSAGGALALRERLLELAGCDLVEQAALTRCVIDKFRQLIDSRKVQRLVVNDGLHHSEVREFIDEDGALQARAAAELRDLLGLSPSKTTTGGGGTTALQVNVTLLQPPNAPRKGRTAVQVVDITPTRGNAPFSLVPNDIDRE